MYKTLIVDSSPMYANMLFDICSTFDYLEPAKFTDPEEAVKYSRNAEIDLAFLDIDMPFFDGIAFGLILREKNPNLVLIFISSSEESCAAAMRIKADGFIFKPYSMSDIAYAVERSRILLFHMRPSLYIRTFGHFDVFINSSPITFSNAKAKELLALCVDNAGADLSLDFVLDRLWPKRPHDDRVKRLYRKAVSNIHSTLSKYTPPAVFTNSRGHCRIIPEAFSCDYYLYKMNPCKYNLLLDLPYLPEYSWARKKSALIRKSSIRK